MPVAWLAVMPIQTLSSGGKGFLAAVTAYFLSRCTSGSLHCENCPPAFARPRFFSNALCQSRDLWVPFGTVSRVPTVTMILSGCQILPCAMASCMCVCAFSLDWQLKVWWQSGCLGWDASAFARRPTELWPSRVQPHAVSWRLRPAFEDETLQLILGSVLTFAARIVARQKVCESRFLSVLATDSGYKWRSRRGVSSSCPDTEGPAGFVYLFTFSGDVAEQNADEWKKKHAAHKALLFPAPSRHCEQKPIWRLKIAASSSTEMNTSVETLSI